MHINIDIEFSSKLKNTQDLRSGVRIVSWSRADYICASPQTLDDQLFRSWQIRQPVLRKHANLNVSRPSVGGFEPLDRVEAAWVTRLGQKPPRYLKSGDVVELGIETLGRQRQVLIDAS